jgi:glutamine synthetase
MLAAGLDGIENRLEPPLPAEEDLIIWTASAPGWRCCPEIWATALAALNRTR